MSKRQIFGSIFDVGKLIGFQKNPMIGGEEGFGITQTIGKMIFIPLALPSIEKMLHKLAPWWHVGFSIGGGFILNILIIGNIYFRWLPISQREYRIHLWIIWSIFLSNSITTPTSEITDYIKTIWELILVKTIGIKSWTKMPYFPPGENILASWSVPRLLPLVWRSPLTD